MKDPDVEKMSKVFLFDRDMQIVIKTHKIVISIKKKTLGFKKYLMTHEVTSGNLNHFNLVNEIQKTLKIDKKEM
jgi:hypothetical protein